MGNQDAPKAPAGWYPIEEGKPGERYWDGTKWDGKTRGLEAPKKPSIGEGKETSKATTSKRNWLLSGFVAVAILAVLATFFIFSQPSSDSLNTVKKAVAEVFPNCDLQKIAPKTDEAMLKSEIMYDGERQKESEFIETCNVAGLDVNQYFELEGYGSDLICLWGEGISFEERIAKMNECGSALEANAKAGYWVLVRKFQNPEKALASIQKQAEESYEYNYGADAPMAILEDTVFTFYALENSLPATTINAMDSNWNKLIALTKATPLSEIDLTYPNTFLQDDLDLPGLRQRYQQAMQILGTQQNCSPPLSISETSYSVGACGSLDVSVFQADLNTGNCQFLGDWTDSNGNSKTGLFDFCPQFTEGSFVEGNQYSILVRVAGATSYLTKGGWQNNVLSFEVIG